VFVYVRFCGDYFECKRYSSIQRILSIALEDFKSRKVIPCSIIDEFGVSIYNKKDLLKAIEDMMVN
jgi:hypothetical protein